MSALWMDRGRCRDLSDPEVMFPTSEDANTPLSIREIEVAKSVCRPCPVRSECREWAIETGQDAGIWGGLSSPERRALASERVA